jgi:hypothetical protein
MFLLLLYLGGRGQSVRPSRDDALSVCDVGGVGVWRLIYSLRPSLCRGWRISRGGECAGGLALERFEEFLFFFWEARWRGAVAEGELWGLGETMAGGCGDEAVAVQSGKRGVWRLGLGCEEV